jgi:hypothetical protein
MITNLDVARKFFKKAEFELENNTYIINDHWFIVWLDEERFTVDHTYLDLDVGYITEVDLFYGCFIDCLSFIQDEGR